jgi:hypothetical protein
MKFGISAVAVADKSQQKIGSGANGIDLAFNIELVKCWPY